MTAVSIVTTTGTGLLLMSYAAMWFLVRGSRSRYILASLCRTMLPVYWADGFVGVYLSAVADRSPVWTVCDLLVRVFISYRILTWDEDDYWHGRGRKIGRWLVRRLSSARPGLAGAR